MRIPAASQLRSTDILNREPYLTSQTQMTFVLFGLVYNFDIKAELIGGTASTGTLKQESTWHTM